MQNKLEPKYLARLATFEHLHPRAYRFLKLLEDAGRSGESGLWLSTSVNAHLYKGDSFLMYLKLNSQQLRPPALLLSPQFNQLIHASATDRSQLLFPKLITKLVMDHTGFSARWAALRSGTSIELTTSAPDTFFDALFATIQGLDVPA